MARFDATARGSSPGKGVLKVGESVGSIRIQGVLGAGGMGEVYVGFDETLRRRVAVKAISQGHRLSPAARARFLREARVLSQLDHPNICRIYDYIDEGDREFLVLELIEGETLGAAILRSMTPQARLRIARDVAAVLATAHGEGIVHRDLKPDNVMLAQDGEVKVLDFGLARPVEVEGATDGSVEIPREPASDTREAGATVTFAHVEKAPPRPTLGLQDGEEPGAESTEGSSRPARTEIGAVMGTPQFMSPEQARGEPATPASDMYSFGLLVQTLFTGRPPFDADLSVAEVLALARNGETLPVTGVDSDLATLIERLESLAPATRPTAVMAVERLDWIRDKPKRRVRWAVAAAVLALLGLGGLKYTLDVRHERNVAEQRRGQAEDLIGFMLGDLREKLEPVGRLEILDDVGEKAMGYFAAVPEAELSDDELLARSKALYQIGDVRIKRGDLAAAEQPMRESLALARELARRSPDDADRLFGLGQSYFWVGFVLWNDGKLEEAREPFEAYLEVSEQLVSKDPANLDWVLELSYAHSNLGSLLQAQGDLTLALERFRTCLAIDERLVASDPENTDWKFELAATHNTVGVVLKSMGRVAEARAHFRADLDLRQAMVELDPTNTTWLDYLATSHKFMGDLLQAQGEWSIAHEHFDESLEVFRRLVAHDPSNLEWHYRLAGSHRLVGQTWRSRREPERALEAWLREREIFRRLVEEDPSNPLWRVWLATAQHDVALALAELDDARALDAALEASRQLGHALDERPDDRRARRRLSETYVLLGRLESARGAVAEADRYWTQAVNLIEHLARDPGDESYMSTWAEALLLLDRLAEAKPLVARLTQSGYREPAFVELCEQKGI